MHIHILGICGTFMGSLAQLAKALGHRVTGCDANVYPPMSTQLEAAGIELIEGFDPEQLKLQPDLIVIGNAMSRGNPLVEAILNSPIPYTSGPQWLADYVLRDRWVLAAAGTHGKTTTSSMLAWISEYAGMMPGFLIGGVPKNFDVSARLGGSPFFVVEADEYDSAFFDKRSKFIHYRPRTAILNNLEFDHADIFDDLAAIQKQFHHLVRTVPSQGMVISPSGDKALGEVLAKGCWSEQARFAIVGSVTDSGVVADPIAAEPSDCEWLAKKYEADGTEFGVWHQGQAMGCVTWSHTGDHNVCNALAAIAAARHVGVTPETAIAALAEFTGVKRRMECLATINGVKVYDDFAHHPTAIATTLAGLRAQVGGEKIIAIIEPRSNTMRMGVHKQQLGQACVNADDVLWYQPADVNWSLDDVVNHSPVAAKLVRSIDELIDTTLQLVEPGCHIVIMSNGGFGGVHQRLVKRLQECAS